MKTLLLMRHASTEWGNAGANDHDRELDQKGLIEAPRMGQVLLDYKIVPDLLVASTAKRAQSTAHALAMASEYHGEIQSVQDLYLAEPVTYYKTLRDISDSYSTVLVVGHNPGIAQLAMELTGVQSSFSTANLAHIELDIANWSELNGKSDGLLNGFFRPREEVDHKDVDNEGCFAPG